MRVFALILGILLIIGGYFKIDFLLSIFSYHNLLMEIFGKKRFCCICIAFGVFCIIYCITPG